MYDENYDDYLGEEDIIPMIPKGKKYWYIDKKNNCVSFTKCKQTMTDFVRYEQGNYYFSEREARDAFVKGGLYG